MSCESIEENISSHVDGTLNGEERKILLTHIQSCRVCSARVKSLEGVRAGLRQLEQPPVPARLAVQLRVLASHERVRQLARASWSARLRYWAGYAQLHFDNLMRPMALPLAGGLLSAILLFGALVPNLSFVYKVGGEPPLSINIEPDGKVVDWMGELPRLEPVTAITSSDENVVELTIDDRGNIADYSVLQGELTPAIQNIILFSRFTPAMFFYQPAWGKKLVIVPRRRNVRG